MTALEKQSTDETPPIGLRQRKKAQQRRRITETAVELFREKGYEHTTVEEIVRRVEISQPTFYNYFSSKEAVLREVALALLARWARRVRAQLEVDQPTEDKLRLMYKRMAQGMSDDKALWRAIVIADALSPFRDEQQREAEAELQHFLVELLEEGQRRGEITRDFSARELVASLIPMQINRCMAWGVDMPRPHELEARLMAGLDFFLRGARP